ncbi:MAG: peptide deformylase [Candidatus Omnitrophica bacterium]|nr:peptide deformylase [Candidatus Omnitrophota bacterium]
MSVRPLCVRPHPILSAHARRVEASTAEIRQFAQDLIETMYAHDGIGLAAPQIGRDIQIFVANPTQQRGRELVVINPVLESSEGRAGVVEGCLSLPKTWERVRRAARVRMRGEDISGKPLAITAEGLLAIVLQHEFDHLQGRLFIDRLPWFRRIRAEHRMRSAIRSRHPDAA